MKELKDQMLKKEYEAAKADETRQNAKLHLDGWTVKAAEARNSAIDAIQEELNGAYLEKQLAEEAVLTAEALVKNQIEDKKKERNRKNKESEKLLEEKLALIIVEIEDERLRIGLRVGALKAESNKELEDQGADVERIAEIEIQLKGIGAELSYIEEHRDRVAEYHKDKRELFDKVDEFKAEKQVLDTKLSGAQQRHEMAMVKLQESVRTHEEEVRRTRQELREMDEDLHNFADYSGTDTYLTLVGRSQKQIKAIIAGERLSALIAKINECVNASNVRMNELKGTTNRFLGNFSADNIFGFKTILSDDEEYLNFSENLREFLEENKIDEYEKRTNEHFASLVSQVGKETTELVSKEAMIEKVIRDINNDFEARNFAGVIGSIQLRLTPSANQIVTLLQEIRAFNDENALSLGKTNLFSTADTSQNNKKAVSYLKQFSDEIARSKQNEITLSDTFELQFRIVENDNDSGWVEKLSNVGSEGTDVLVKAMINIMLLNVFKESASKKFKEFRLHCMMDEIGKLHPNNVKGILKFANDRNIMLINSSPTSYNTVDYKHTYILKKDKQHMTTIKRLITTAVNYGN